jgi:hypothetical protein
MHPNLRFRGALGLMTLDEDLLRVIRKGRQVKDAVDEVIDQCGEVENLLDSIEHARVRADQSSNEGEKKELAQTGTLQYDLIHLLSSQS